MARKIILKGIVQGVGCRGYCAKYARKLNIHGSATNLSNGSVCIIIRTDNDDIVNLYMESLIANPERYHFFGRITGYDVSSHSGSTDGDYTF